MRRDTGRLANEAFTSNPIVSYFPIICQIPVV